ncbi:MAG: FkbM family methyltransferase [Candidatus Sulfotelmatobacter sp.]
MSTTLRQAILKSLRVLGVRSFKAKSGLGYPFLCHVGDFSGEVPFHNREYSRAEILLMAAWCGRHPDSLVFDVGANVGFVATQLAQASKSANCRILAFEPVYDTFAKLTESVRRLGLEGQVSVVCCAVSDKAGGLCSVAFDNSYSLYAQVKKDMANSQAGHGFTWSSELTLDSIAASIGCRPTLVKIDVEGYEAHVLRGARTLLESPDAPVVCFELNPKTLGEVGSDVESVATALKGYRFFYVDDFEGQRIPHGEEIADLASLTWCCNLFAAPRALSENEIVELFK